MKPETENEHERIVYTVITVLVILTGIITGVWIGQNRQLMINKIPDNAHTTTSAEAKETPIYFVETNEKKLSISFDAAWGCEHTQTILDTLAAHNVKATFFLTNIWLEEYPDMAKTIADAGHEIAMHSVSHPHMPELSTSQMQEELQGNYDLIVETTQYKPELFRFPFGDYNNQSIQVVRENGYYPVQWSIDSLDWQESNTTEDIVNRVVMGLHPGAIILCHNNGTHTADAIAEILPYAMEQGYTFVPIGELIYKGDYMTDHQGMQKKCEDSFRNENLGETEK